LVASATPSDAQKLLAQTMKDHHEERARFGAELSLRERHPA
jgi:hypothetical protein